MKLRVRVAAALLVVSCLLSCGFVIPTSAADSGNSDVRYTQKIVSVLYDNSGSMLSQNKNEYALYALQMLMSLLDENDVLVITPMNNYKSIEINLSSSDRNAEITQAMTSSNSFLSKSPSGGTPGSTIRNAVVELENRGLKNQDNLWASSENKEYWLLVLTDGSFNEQNSSVSAGDVIEKYIKDFPSLKTIYLGLGADSPDLNGSSLTQKYMFTPCRAATTNDIVDTMQDVANMLSGRYTLDSDDYKVNGSKVTIDLNNSDISFKSISVIAQNCGATLNSATYNGKTMKISKPCIISPDSALNLKEGFSATIEGTPYLSGGTMVLEFNGKVSADYLSVLAEPALNIVPYLEYQNGSTWERTNMQYINANLSGGDLVRVGYEVYEQAGGGLVDLEKVFGNSDSSVTYAGKTYKAGEDIPLVVGNNDIGISVSVMDGAYTVYSSMICIIEANPTYYRVEAQHGNEIPTSTRSAQTVYTVYANNSPLSLQNLSSYKWEVTATAPDGSKADITTRVGTDGKITLTLNAAKNAYGDYKVHFVITSEYGLSREYSHTLKYFPKTLDIKGEHPDEVPSGAESVECFYTVHLDGIQLTKEELEEYAWGIEASILGGTAADAFATLEEDGRIKVILDTKMFGTYELKLSVAITGDFKNEYTHSIRNYPSSISMGVISGGGYEITQYQLTVNNTPIEFELFSDGLPFVFDNGLTTYKIFVGNTDVTAFASATGNRLSYIPKLEHFSNSLPTGEQTVTVIVDCAKLPSLNTTASTTFKVTDTVYSVVPVSAGNNKVDRFNLSDLDASVYFKIMRDGVPLTVEELQSALDNGEITVKDEKGTFTWQFWLPVGSEFAPVTVNGEPMLEFKTTRDWIKMFGHFIPMVILDGDKPITVTYCGVEGAGSIEFEKSAVWSYIWRVLVILLIIHTCLYLIGFVNGKCLNHTTGLVVSITLGKDTSKESFRVDRKVNYAFKDKFFWHLLRFIPHKKSLWYHQPDVSIGSRRATLYRDQSGQFGISFRGNDMYKLEKDDNGSEFMELFRAYESDLRKYDGKKQPPVLRNVLAQEVRAVFSRDFEASAVAANTLQDVGKAYGKFDEKGKLIMMVFFVTKSNF